MSVWAEWVTAAGTAMAGLATLVAGWAAIRGVDAWRSEMVGRRKAELAEEVLTQFYRARDVLTWARVPDRPLDVAVQPDDRDRRHRSHASPIERLTRESALFSELQASRYRFMAYFGEESAHLFEEIRAIHSEVISSAQSLIRNPNEQVSDSERDRWEDAIGWMGDGEDLLALRLAKTIAAVERVCRPLIADHHRPRLATTPQPPRERARKHFGTQADVRAERVISAVVPTLSSIKLKASQQLYERRR